MQRKARSWRARQPVEWSSCSRAITIELKLALETAFPDRRISRKHNDVWRRDTVLEPAIGLYERGTTGSDINGRPSGRVFAVVIEVVRARKRSRPQPSAGELDVEGILIRVIISDGKRSRLGPRAGGSEPHREGCATCRGHG